MKLAFSIIFLIVSKSIASCQLNEYFSYVSLSAPISSVLQELSLLEDSSLKYVSSFHPVTIKKSKKLYGGNFVSLKELKNLKNVIVFYDESRSLKKIIQKEELFGVKISTRGEDPFVTVNNSYSKLKKYLKNCDDKIKENIKKLKSIKVQVIDDFSSISRKLVFFLGKIKSKKIPDLLIGNDGIVSFLKLHTNALEYQTNAAYLPWSSSILNKIKENSLFIALSQGALTRVDKITDSNMINIQFNGVLSPGWSQVYFLGQLKKMIF